MVTSVQAACALLTLCLSFFVKSSFLYQEDLDHTGYFPYFPQICVSA